MTYKQFKPKTFGRIPPWCVSKEKLNCDVVVISASKMFNRLFDECKDEQLDMFGLNKFYNNRCYIYLNNFSIMIDTVFRLIRLFDDYYTKIQKRFKPKEIIIINDLNKLESTEDPKIIAKNICPKKWYMYNYLVHHMDSDDEIYRQMMWKLKTLRNFLDDEEIEDYDCWEVLLSKKFPNLYDFCLRGRLYKLHNYYAKQKVLNQFLYLVSLSQMQLTQFEIYVCWKYVLKIIRKNGYNVYECENKSFDYNIVHNFTNKRTLFISNRYVICENIFFYDDGKIYYPFLMTIYKNYLKDIPDENVKLIKRTKFKKEYNNMMNLFDVCESECNGKILDINSAYSMIIFNDMESLYVEKEFKEIKPDKIEETEYSWVLRDSYADLINSWINAFNKISKIKIL